MICAGLLLAVLWSGAGAQEKPIHPIDAALYGREILKPAGDTVAFQARWGLGYTGELLAINDTTVYFKAAAVPAQAQVVPGEIVAGRVSSLYAITVKGQKNRRWRWPLVVLQVIPAAVLAVTAATFENNSAEDGMGVFVIASIPTLFNFAIFQASTQPARFTFPLGPDRLQDLQKHARFPQGLTPDQMEQFLRAHQQGAIRHWR